MNQETTAIADVPQPAQQSAAQAEDDFFSDAPLPTCPLRKDGMGEGEICEACQ